MNLRFVALAALALALGAGSLATAQQAVSSPAPAAAPTPIVLPTLPPNTKIDPLARQALDALTSIVKTQIHNIGNSSSGTVTYYKHFEMQVQTGANVYRNVHLHQGTIINPRGESIQIGQQVAVGGDQQADGSLNANVITIQH